jgi:hypothetical protein
LKNAPNFELLTMHVCGVLSLSRVETALAVALDVLSTLLATASSAALGRHDCVVMFSAGVGIRDAAADVFFSVCGLSAADGTSLDFSHGFFVLVKSHGRHGTAFSLGAE